LNGFLALCPGGKERLRRRMNIILP